MFVCAPDVLISLPPLCPCVYHQLFALWSFALFSQPCGSAPQCWICVKLSVLSYALLHLMQCLHFTLGVVQWESSLFMSKEAIVWAKIMQVQGSWTINISACFWHTWHGFPSLAGKGFLWGDADSGPPNTTLLQAQPPSPWPRHIRKETPMHLSGPSQESVHVSSHV